MTTHITSLEAQNVLAQSQPLTVFSQMAVNVAMTVVKWETRARTRRALSKLDAAQLEDCGLSRDVAYTEAHRPFRKD
ncbi:DUF1127 domain-containing protein [Cochlodiniinecator piscidefendens]|uniref:DUF1127 domain-containing protein n=1 Tax=Cochlodiniinecator piscidefendens TaxID=2715756 RepID=UPI0014077715|nr:DUF1127 domain-containing protein [Cochlodiniinecator piscidefendens]